MTHAEDIGMAIAHNGPLNLIPTGLEVFEEML